MPVPVLLSLRISAITTWLTATSGVRFSGLITRPLDVTSLTLRSGKKRKKITVNRCRVTKNCGIIDMSGVHCSLCLKRKRLEPHVRLGTPGWLFEIIRCRFLLAGSSGPSSKPPGTDHPNGREDRSLICRAEKIAHSDESLFLMIPKSVIKSTT